MSPVTLATSTYQLRRLSYFVQSLLTDQPAKENLEAWARSRSTTRWTWTTRWTRWPSGDFIRVMGMILRITGRPRPGWSWSTTTGSSSSWSWTAMSWSVVDEQTAEHHDDTQRHCQLHLQQTRRIHYSFRTMSYRTGTKYSNGASGVPKFVLSQM